MPSATVQPALIIGLGGSGIDIVRRFKRRFSTLYPDTPYVRLLGIDTAPQTAASANLPVLTDDEFIHSAQFDMRQYVGDGRVDQHPTIRNWWKGFDTLPLKAVAMGAGQRRPVGRLALFVQHQQIMERLRRDVHAIFNDRYFAELAPEYRKLINIYIVSSTCGGTGTGMFMDLAYLTREVVRQSLPGVTPRVRSILLLPSVFIDTGAVPNELNHGHLRANAYGALTELDYAMSPLAKLNPITYPDGREVSCDEAPFKGCYLVGNQTSSGAVITSIEEVLEKSATHLMIELASPLTSTGDAILDNTIDRIATNGTWQGRPRLYSSFTGDWLELPSARVLARWTKHYALHILDRLGSEARRGHKNEPLKQLRLSEGYGALKDLVSGTGLRRYEPKLEAAMSTFQDISEEGESAATLTQRAQMVHDDAEGQIRGNQAFNTVVDDAVSRIFPEVETQVENALQEGSLSEAKQLLTAAQAELETWLTRSRERGSQSSGHWLSDFNRQANELKKGILQSRRQFASVQRRMVIDAADAARRDWDVRLRARVGQALEDRLPGTITQIRQLRQKIEQVQVAVDGAAALISRRTQSALPPGSGGVACSDEEIDQAFNEPGRLEALQTCAREALGSLLQAPKEADRFAEEVWELAALAVRVVAPEYLRSLHISTDTISERVNRLSPLAVFTEDWRAHGEATLEPLCLVGLPESMNDRGQEVKAGIQAELRSKVQVVTHLDDERVVLTMQNHGFPLFALAEVDQCRHAFETSEPETQPLRFILAEKGARNWTMMPLNPKASKVYFALSFPLQWIRRTGQAYQYRAHGTSTDILLGSDPEPALARERARDTFLQKGYGSAVKTFLDERVQSEGNQTLYTELSLWLEQQDEIASANADYPDEFRKDIMLVRDYHNSIRPF